MSNPFVPIRTADLEWRGDLPFSVLYDDIYFSAESGIKQGRHVFIDGNNLIQRWQELSTTVPTQFNIGETGFGTGLNFLLTWHLWEQYAPSMATLHFISCEKHPLTIDDLKKSLSFWPELAEHARQLIDSYPVLTPGYHHLSFSDGRVNLTLMLGEALESYEQLLICGESILESELRTAFVDAWYLDGFAPKKNESMWSESLLKVIALLSKEGTTLATYTAAASVKAILRKVGFTVGKKKGFAQKRHMVCARFEKNSSLKIKTRHTPWHVCTPMKQQKKSAIIVGAGLAGAFTAHSLAKRGWQVTIVDELDAAGKGGSANVQAVLFPKLSAYKSPLTQLMLLAFVYAKQFYKNILNQFKLGELNGILLLAYNEQEKKIQQSLDNWLLNYPELGELIDKERASDLTGLLLDHPGLFIPQSGWINSPLLCQTLIEQHNISLLTGCTVDSLAYDTNQWIVHDRAAPVLILANGPRVNSFKETEHLPVKAIRGQMTAISSTMSSSKLQIPICAEGHILPKFDGVHHLGATYDLGISSSTIDPHDDGKNLVKLNQIADASIWSNHIVGHWAGVRASTPDYLPLVGQVPIEDEFTALFAGLETNSKRWIAKAGSYYPGLYICAGFGSRGLTTVPLCAEWLATVINNEMSCLPRNLVQALSPARFLRRNIMRGFKA
ncbi:bifunctional tRNA (5-methylaminomethyl-2-thiouridine)(34)-methyltransferase MnmD/FAD-dependent 5-carboxymethylaminomethyl-2-thiouridine(34) oxidoreductase MnmC [Legionella fallonii]|uniref:tRNA 5-methylaminomethyl-2-thiouridine biosynthesis bifunctional protein MnmC n=1 Tax=Legionella fallonii LLAP-10 TaxID=1212491 RepID=A0A098G4V8_9GAMM|nr:bifunctional tRNA (5-methylaminomethyl-2-thiouridine)(34)-methyltransferase MnmD/FAD-dependent 5-carboxymethylaminomethyl-2-thiouridine(34) oxidoreductase MnmC [Legionella fallonii]CEG57001.1 tRNA 5-methylaminomethyl-2-thiouridine biosynthesis bifunctional protein MnmC [Includes: tRNA (mnm(5)s(2)U34)-methyltransferase; FAD-dependent cmnm(5)s(2)U34 oxidoreductase] [Legionella fallonii LLAP-10]